MKDALEYIVHAIVENTDKVEVTEESEGSEVNYTIRVASEDIGKVIGKNGKVIRAIRNVMKIPAMKHNVRVSINLGE